MRSFPRLESSVIKKAFELHHAQYGEEGWPEAHHLNLADNAVDIVASGSLEGFNEVYNDLKGRWQVFRGTKNHWSSVKVKTTLHQFLTDKDLRRFAGMSLRELKDKDVPELWSVLETMRGSKPLKNDDSVVAVSKFLHFFNPRLFVIVDDAVVWKYVLDHWWLWDTLEPFIEKVQRLVPDAEKSAGKKCDLVDFLGVLLWSRAILRKCSTLMSDYRRHLFGTLNHPSKVAGEYEALAVEWFLLGLVEIPPAGFGADT